MHLGLAAIVVADYDPAIAFFTGALGFELAEDSAARTTDGRAKRWVVVRPPGAETGLLLARADGPAQAAVVGNQTAGRVGFFLQVPDFEAAYARMTAAGVRFEEDPREEPYGRVVVFRDIAGNRWDLIGPAAAGLETEPDTGAPGAGSRETGARGAGSWGAESWGAGRYGDPCRECGFGWGLSPGEAVARVRAVPAAYAARLAGASGRERHPDLTWTAAGYVAHVGDNLRAWAERLAGGYLAGDLAVPGYDPDLLARARGYDEVSLAGALWSLRQAAAGWAEAAETALARGVVLAHATRGAQRAEDVARNNAHDAEHHLWDVGRILGSG